MSHASTRRHPDLFPRYAADAVRVALGDTPVVLVVGPRQSGKTTLVRELVARDWRYVTLDDATTLEAALGDPTGFIRGLDQAIIDEVQRAPELLRAIKVAVDRDRRPGRFLLTGSANVLDLPQVSESLAGRMAVVELLPLSEAEIRGVRPRFLEAALDGRVARPTDLVIAGDLVETVLTGGFPEMHRRADPDRRRAWALDYLNAILRRDVPFVAGIAHPDAMRVLFQAVARHSGQLTNFSQLAGRVGVDDKTASRYLAVLERLYMVRRLPPWFRNPLKRLVKTPKVHVLDSGLLAATLGLTADQVGRDRTPFGPVLESYVHAELLRQAGWLPGGGTLHHYRDKDMNEVDLVFVAPDGGAIAIEVKATATVREQDFAGIRKVAAAMGRDFRLGLVLHDSDQTIPFGHALYAAPLSALWGTT
ncbi:MAG TPA: ATP-binding protein [Longimicrobiales bacterium]|nr:ATP-binding protein [Longimicrobiales bacterium]